MRLSKLIPVPMRRRWRIALPSTMVGLVAFSLTLLGFGTVVYTNSLPLLAASSGRFADILSTALYAGASVDGTLSEGEDGQASDGASAEGAGDGQNAAASSSLAAGDSSFTFGTSGLSLGDLMEHIQSGGSSSGKDDGSSGSGQGQSSNKPGGNTGGGSGGNGSGNGGSGSGSGGNQGGGSAEDGEGEGDGSHSATDEQTREVYEYLVAKAETIQGLESELASCIRDFEADSLNPDISVRLSRQRACDSVTSRLYSGWSEMINYPGIVYDTPYNDAMGKMIGMYRCLYSYASCYSEAWDVNVAYDDPTGYVDAFMGPLEGADSYLSDYERYANGFVL